MKNNFIVRKMCGVYNRYLRAKIVTFVSTKHGVKAKLTFLFNGSNKMARSTVDIIGIPDLEIFKGKYKTNIGIPHKMELADVELYRNVVRRVLLIFLVITRNIEGNENVGILSFQQKIMIFLSRRV